LKSFNSKGSILLLGGCLFLLCIFSILSISESNSIDNHEKSIVITGAIEIIIESEPDPLKEGSFLVGSELYFEIEDDAYESVEIEVSNVRRLVPVEMEKNLAGNLWSGTLDTEEPKFGDVPLPSGTYQLNLIIDDEEEVCTPNEIKLSQGGSNTMIIIIIISIIGAVSVSALVVVKKKQAAKREDVEFGEVDKMKSKKKGEVYSGASSIGKRSGKIAETKKKSKTSALERSPDEESADLTHFKHVKGAFGVSTSSPEIKEKSTASAAKKQLMPADTGFKFETKASASAAIIKNMELKMDLDSKVEFITSKIESNLQNIEFFKAILAQHEQEELFCPDCNKKMSTYWIMCPYCEISEHDSELSLKASMLLLGEDVKFCPDCKRLIKPNWIDCPFCYVKNE